MKNTIGQPAQTNHADKKTSPNFIGSIGKQISPADFPLANIVTDSSKYALDGNWAFCRFDDDEIIGARFGWSRGFYGMTDYGYPMDQPDDGCGVRIEIVTRDGAYLWIEQEKYNAQDISIPQDEYKHSLTDKGHKVIELEGWPAVRWKMSSDDGFLSIDANLCPSAVFILPDSILRKSRFSMWLAVCSFQGLVKIGGREKTVRGTAFYDHSRITRENNDAAEFGSYNYLPIWFEDNSYFICYYSEQYDGKRNDGYSFGCHIDSDRTFSEFEPDGEQTISFDEDNQLKTCSSKWKSGDVTLTINVTAEPVGIAKAWGTGAVPQTLAENRVFPLPFKCFAEITQKGIRRSIVGKGLNEYIRNPRLHE